MTTFATAVNNFSSKLRANYTAGDATLKLKLGDGAQLKAITSPNFYRVTVFNASKAYSPNVASTDFSIYQVTKATDVTDDLTIVSVLNGPLGTVDRNYPSGSIVELRITAGTFSDIHQAVNTLETNVTTLQADDATNQTNIAALVSGLATTNGNVSAVTASDALKAPIANPTFTGTVNGTFSGNLTGNVTGNVSGTAGGLSANIAESQVTSLVTDLAAKAPLASPQFTGGLTKTAGLTTPVISSVTPNSTGSVTYSYQVVAVDTNGNKSLPSAKVTITNGAAPPNNTITWGAVTGAASYDLLLTPLATPAAPNVYQGGANLYTSSVVRSLVMGSNTGYAPDFVTSSAETTPTWQAYDSVAGTMWSATFSNGMWTQYDFGVLAPPVIVQYAITGSAITNQSPNSWTLVGSNDATNWSSALDTQTSQTFTASQKKTYTVSSVTTKYQYYRLVFTANNGGALLGIIQIDWYTAGSTVYNYAVMAVDANGFRGAPGLFGNTVTGPSALDATNQFNVLTWPSVPGANHYEVLRQDHNRAVSNSVAQSAGTITFNVTSNGSVSNWHTATGNPVRVVNQSGLTYTDTTGAGTIDANGNSTYVMPVVNNPGNFTSAGQIVGDVSQTSIIPTYWDASNGAYTRPYGIVPGSNFTSLSARLGNVFNAREWGAKGDSVTDDWAAINAMLTFMATRLNPGGTGVPNIVYFPSGTYMVSKTILIAARLGGYNPGANWAGIHFFGDGYQTCFQNTTTMTEMIRVEDVTQGIFRDFQIKCNTKPDNTALRVSVAAFHITAVLSGESCVVQNLAIDCNNTCPVGIGVSLDYPNDLSQLKLYNCTIQGSAAFTVDASTRVAVTVDDTHAGIDAAGYFVVPNMTSAATTLPITNAVAGSAGAGIKVGSGLSGNVLDITAYGCRVKRCDIGIWLDGGPMVAYGCNFEQCYISDVFNSQSTSGALKFDGFRSEFPNKTFWAAGGGNTPCTEISNISSRGWFGWTYTFTPNAPPYTPSTFTQGLQEHFMVVARPSGQYILRNLDYGTPQDVHNTVKAPRYNLTAKQMFVQMQNCATSQGTSDALMGYLASGSGLNTSTNFVVLPGWTQDSSGTPGFTNPLGVLISTQLTLSGRLSAGLMNTNPTSGFHMRGGSGRIEALMNPTLPPTVTPTGSGATTYYYSYCMVDIAGNRTLPSPIATTTNAASLDSSHFNTISIPNIQGAAYYEIIVGSAQTAALVQGSTNPNPVVSTFINPYFTATTTVQSFSWKDQTGTNAAWTLPTRNMTADLSVEGLISSRQGLALGGPTQTCGLHQVGGSQRLQAVATPAAPAVFVITTGSTTYDYFIVAEDYWGKQTLASTGTQVTNSASTPNNTISWSPVTGAVKYYVLRYTSGTLPAGSNTTLVGTVLGNTLSTLDNVASGSLGSFTVTSSTSTEMGSLTAPYVSQISSTSSTNYYYFVVGEDKFGLQTAASSPSLVQNSSTIPNNIITWAAIPGAVKHHILRNTTSSISAGAHNVKVCTHPDTAQLFFTDTVASPSAFTTPTRNNTADSTIDGQLVLGGAASMNSGSGAPGIGGVLGDYYFRTDTPSTANQRVYVCTTAGAPGAAVWTGIV